MKSLRTRISQVEYDNYVKSKPAEAPCELCGREAMTSFKFWKIILNRFPYDRIADHHTMLVPIRHITEKELSEEEYRELVSIKESQLNEYRYIIEATPITKSIPLHLHFHLVNLKDFED